MAVVMAAIAVRWWCAIEVDGTVQRRAVLVIVKGDVSGRNIGCRDSDINDVRDSGGSDGVDVVLQESVEAPYRVRGSALPGRPPCHVALLPLLTPSIIVF
ncbi:hypothetical protein E2C01_069214 [Portunus trituberculatus]|uniref:Uncharacterized protein n=1 Tax=Portunus trituberculatus TaxID=210409 RepID=A0A5B7I1K2_PORTR|nr:hypothetical protein [Portunus trituberculatus]